MRPFNEIPASDALAAAVEGIFLERIANKATPAVRYTIFDASGIVHENGFGDGGAAGSPPRTPVRFRIASCTKSFTAAAVLLLRDRGQLSLDDAVTRYVPALRPTLPASQPEAPTLRMLLSMAGGLPTDDPWADRQESISSAAFDAILHAGVRFATTPGTRFEYSNLGYALLGRVIEVVGGRPYPAFIAENLLEPLGLLETGFDPADVPSDLMATGFRAADGEWLALPFTGPGAFSAIGGTITGTGDLSRWAGWLSAAFQADRGGEGPLSAASRREMQRIHCVIPPEADSATRLKGYGFGLMIEQDLRYGPIVSHSGGYPGFSSHMRWNPHTGLGMVAFENATYSGVWQPATAAFDLLLNSALGRGEQPVVPPAAVHKLVTGLQSLLADGWDDALANTIFLDNVNMDNAYTARAVSLVALRNKAGVLEVDKMEIRPADPGGACDGFGRFELHLPCAAGEIIAKALCGPLEPMKIQSIEWQLRTYEPP